VIADRVKANKIIKKGRRELRGVNHISCVLSKTGEVITDQDNILKRIEEFYTDLYSSPLPTAGTHNTKKTNNMNLKCITKTEVRYALTQMSNDKAVGPDGISTESLKAGGEILYKNLAKLYTACLMSNTVPSKWKSSRMVLIHKKGDNRNLKNYRPISLLSNMYKLFTKILTNRLQKDLDENQPEEQAGFRSGYSTMDHIHVINQLREKCAEYQRPLCMALVDYEKAFDSIETSAVLTSLEQQNIEEVYINTLAGIYKNSYTTTKLHKESAHIPICKGVRQGDTISPKLFTAGLENIFQSLSWEDKGISINGKRLNNLRFADDVALIGESLEDIGNRLNELANESKLRGLKINMEKTKILKNQYVIPHSVFINDTEIEQVDSYIYLGQRVSLVDKAIDKEIARRIQAGWKAFNENKDILTSNAPMCLKRKLYNQCILPAMTYASETWAMTAALIKKLAVVQRKMERIMLGITWKDHMTNEWIRNKTKIKDVIHKIRGMKWTWAGHISRMKDARWTVAVTEWRPREGERKKGRPLKRWRDDIDKFWESVTWKRQAQNRALWKSNVEAFIQQVDR
jgi:hypothetical protein